jgi:hypothetical protein
VHVTRTPRRAAIALGTALLAAGCIGFPDPAELPGRWGSTKAPAMLEFGGGRWRLANGGLVKQGVYDTSGNRVAFLIDHVNRVAYQRYCRDEVDVYEWRLEDGGLVLRSVGDVCDDVARAVLTAGPWVRREGG